MATRTETRRYQVNSNHQREVEAQKITIPLDSVPKIRSELLGEIRKIGRVMSVLLEYSQVTEQNLIWWAHRTNPFNLEEFLEPIESELKNLHLHLQRESFANEAKKAEDLGSCFNDAQVEFANDRRLASSLGKFFLLPPQVFFDFDQDCNTFIHWRNDQIVYLMQNGEYTEPHARAITHYYPAKVFKIAWEICEVLLPIEKMLSTRTDGESKKGGRKKKLSDEDIKRIQLVYEDEYGKCKDSRSTWNKVAKLYGFKKGDSARKYITRNLKRIKNS